MNRRKRTQFWGAHADDDSLVREILAGRKTATVCKADEYYTATGEFDDGCMEAGELIDVHDLRGKLRCVIRVTGVYPVRFGQVPEKLWRGEGCTSAEHFREVHRQCWPHYELTDDFELIATHFELVPAADELLALLAGRRGHFRMESGYHSELWFDLNRLFAEPDRLRPFVTELARRLQPHGIDAVCGPMSGGAKLAEMIAADLGVEAFVSERFEPASTERLFAVRYEIPPAMREGLRQKRVAIVDDAFSAGSAARATLADLLACGAQPRAFGALIVFGEAMARFAAEKGLPLEATARMDFRMWLPAECPLCRAQVPLHAVAEG